MATGKVKTDFEKVEELLQKYKIIKNEIEGIEISIKHIGEKGMNYTGMPSSSGISNTVDNNYNELKKLENDKSDKEFKIAQIDNMLKLLTEDEYDIIKLRYFKEFEMFKVAANLNMHPNTVYNKRLKMFNKKLIPYAVRFKLIK